MAKWTKWNGPSVIRKMNKANARAINVALEEVGGHSDQEIPLRTGAALQSKHVTMTSEIEQTGIGAISYGGGPGTGHPVVPYVPFIHEIPKNYQRGRKSNFLRDPFNARAERTYRKALQMQAKGEGF